MTRPSASAAAVNHARGEAPPGFRASLRQVHLRIGLIALLSLLPASGMLASVAIETQLVLVALPIALLGVMHGGLDPWVGDLVMRSRLGRSSRSLFIGGYLAVMAVVVACWILLPLETLVAFLLVSVLHFGEQDAFAFSGRKDALAVVVFGALPVLGPIASHPGEVAMIFGWLTGSDEKLLSQILPWLAQPLLALWLVGAGMFIARMFMERDPDPRFQVFGLLVLVASMLFLPPLIAFAAYFCLLHSFGHLLDMATLQSGPWANWTLQQWAARLWPATIGALVLGLVGWGLVGWVLLSGMNMEKILYPRALAQAIFCGLAALTVTHVLLHMVFDNKIRAFDNKTGVSDNKT